MPKLHAVRSVSYIGLGAPARILVLAVLALAALATASTTASAQTVTQFEKNGCQSPEPYSGTLTSPQFSTGSIDSPVTFRAWFEIESINPDFVDEIVVEWSDDGGPWTEFGRLVPPGAPTGRADQPLSNRGLGVTPTFQLYNLTLPPGDTSGIQIRFRFDTLDTSFQGFRGVGIDRIEVVESNDLPVQSFESGLNGWTTTPASGPGAPFWQILNNAQNVSVANPEVNPRLVTLSDSGALPVTPFPTHYAWFGNTDSGTFCGPDFANFFQEPVFDTTPPDTPITSGPPPGPGSDRTPTFTFDSTEPGSRFECSIDGGPFVPCSSPFTTPELSGGPHTLAVRAVDASGNADDTPTVYSFEIARQLNELPPPVLGQEVNVGPVPGSGPIFIAVRGQGSGARTSARASQKGLDFVPLVEARQIPVGSFLNTKRGTVQLVSATPSANRTQSGKFSQGLFQVLQSRARRARGLTEIRLKGGNFRRCRTGRRGKAGAAQVRRRTIRRTRSNTNGRYRARGKHSAGTSRGTVWITADRCDGTLTTVKRGKVAVRDFRRKKTILVRAGKSYLAKAPR
jgi:hypothetical protein